MRKMLQKATAMTAAAILAASLTACGGGSSAPAPAAPAAPAAKEEAKADAPAAPEKVEELVAEEGAEIEIAYWEGSSSDKDAWDLVLANLQKDHPEIKLTIQTYPSNEFRDMLDTRIAGDDWPDVIRYMYQRLGKFKESETMLDLTPYIPQENLDDISEGFLGACKYEGKLVAMPHHTDVIALFYNKRMFEEQGIRIPKSIEDGYTWEEVHDIAKQLKEAYNLPYGCAGIWENGSGYRYLPFMYMNGGALMNEDQTEITIDTPEALAAIQWYDDMRAEDLIANTAFTAASTANSLFVAEQIAFDFAGSWHCSYMQENMGDNWGVTYMPIRNGKTGTDIGGNGIFAYAGTKYPKAAAIVVEYITNAENMKAFCEAGSFIPVRKSIAGKIDYAKFQEPMKLFNEIVDTIDPKMAADETSVPFQQLNVIFNEEMDPLAVNRSATPEQVIANCLERMTESLNDR